MHNKNTKKLNRFLTKTIIIFFLQKTFLFCLELPIGRFELNKSIFLFDGGADWHGNSVFGLNHSFANKIESLKKFNEVSLDSLIIKTSIGITITENKDTKIFSYLLFKHKNFFSYLNPSIVSDNRAFNGFTGIPRKISRFGFNSGETNSSGFGYKNKNILFQIGRGRESWGAGSGIELLLSKDSPSYDYFKFLYDKDKIRFIYFHGFLENIESYNRYITGKGLEFTNKKSMILGFSEVIIYSGHNRSVDFAYLNPTSSHLEIELNDRQNLLGPDDANAVWQISFDYLINSNIRFSSNFIVDELTIDRIELDSGKVSGLGYSSRLSYLKKINNQVLTLYGKYILLGTHTFRHAHGYNNFVQRGFPLGHKFGSDGYSVALGCNYFNGKNLIIKSTLSKNIFGASTITINQYEPFYNDYKNGPFPSGIVDEYYVLDIKFHFKGNNMTNFYIDFKSQNHKNSKINSKINIGLLKDLF